MLTVKKEKKEAAKKVNLRAHACGLGNGTELMDGRWRLLAQVKSEQEQAEKDNREALW